MSGTGRMEIEQETAIVEMEGDVYRFDLVEYTPLSIMKFTVLDRLNVMEFAKPRAGVYALAKTDPHDAQRVEMPYFFGKADDLKAELLKHLDPQEPELAARQKSGELYFRAVLAEPGGLKVALAELKAQYGGTTAAAVA